jgi:uncharacterized protein DUF5107
MIQIRETTREIPFHRPLPLTDLPLIYHREHLFPYSSYGDTDPTPVPRAFRMVILENDALRVEVAPELGGRVYSLFDKRHGNEVLFTNPVVKPVRTLPIGAFISGGMEFNFPIAHSPTSIAEVGCSTGRIGDYGYIRSGEREARTGMEWVVELGLLADQPILIQRTALRNRSGAAHPWMMWTICAVRSTAGTEFIHPPHRVLVHEARVEERDWPGDGMNWDRNHRRMTALFFVPGGAPELGVFHHDLGFGLLHLADPARLPGKKIWTYGHEAHRTWGQATTEGDLSYCEIESGPLVDQGQKPQFSADAERRFTEFWIPVRSRDAFDRPVVPALELPEWSEPWLGWGHSAWQCEWEAFREGAGPLPASVVPTGLALEIALRRELARGNPRAAEPLALWLAFHRRPREALSVIERSREPATCRLIGLINARALRDPIRAIPFLLAGPLHDPVAVVELDELYAGMGMIAQRLSLLAQTPAHRLIIERRADLALALGHGEEALRLLATTDWPREHQRYVRTTLWKRARDALGLPEEEVPATLNEDDLAPFGAYWSDEQD